MAKCRCLQQISYSEQEEMEVRRREDAYPVQAAPALPVR
jgi:hypothetical protein